MNEGRIAFIPLYSDAPESDDRAINGEFIVDQDTGDIYFKRPSDGVIVKPTNVTLGDTPDFKFGPVVLGGSKEISEAIEGKGFTWGVEGQTPVAALEATSGAMEIKGTMKALTYDVGSSRTIKENVNPFESSGLDIINKTDIMSFNYIADESNDLFVGFIAEDTDKLISGEKQNRFKIVNTIGVLMKAVQELSTEIEELKKKDSFLETRLQEV